MAGDYNFDARIELSGEEIAKLYEKADAKKIRKAILRSADVAVGMAVSAARDLMDVEEPLYMKRRAKGMLKEYRRWATRMRGRMIDDTVRAATGSRFLAAYALEIGGRYEQWVNEYTRLVTRQRRGETLSTTRVAVKSHKRHRPEDAKRYLARAFSRIGPVSGEPLRRAIAALIETGKVPHAPQLRRGLL